MVQNSWKKFDHLKNTVKIYASDYYDINVNKDGVKCGTSLRFWENKGWISRFRGKLVKMIRNAGTKHDDFQFCLKLDKCFCIGVMN